MKKWLALMIAAVMLLSCSVAFAESDDIEREGPFTGSVTLKHDTIGFDVTMVVPEGYDMYKYSVEDAMYLIIDNDIQDAPNFVISVAYSEAYADTTMNKFDDEERLALLDEMDDDFMEPQLNDLTTEHGTEVYIINEVYPESESYYAYGFTVYKGYFVQVYLSKPNFAKLEQTDLDMVIKILSDMWFVDAE